MTPTMHPDAVQRAIRQRGTKFATVVFVKKSGELRKINGLFRPASKIVGNDRGQAQGEALRAKGLVPFYSLKDRGWRSFSLDAVVEIR
jgi:hypothetical protein